MNRARFTAALDKFHGLRALCIGDVMLDQYFFGQVHRISPEAPIPVLAIENHSSMLGGAGNVVANVSALEARCSFFSVTGTDASGHQIAQHLAQTPRTDSYLTSDRERVTTTKMRYVAGGQHMLRADHEIPSHVPLILGQRMLKGIEQELGACDVVILSDYRKGVFTDEFCDALMQLLRESGKPVVVDTKARDFGSFFSGAHTVTPNVAELQAFVGRPLLGDSEIALAGEEVMRRAGVSNMLVTRGKDGVMLLTLGGEMHVIPATSQGVCDVSGAGDTVLAAYALAIAAGLTPPEAAYLANIAAGIAVAHVGTFAVSQQALRIALIAEERVGGRAKIMLQNEAKQITESWKREGKRIGFANGCFDLLHASHVMFLQDAREHCDKLIVGLNSDSSVRQVKGEGRPINDELHRALMLAALPCVDAVVIFESATPCGLISVLKPQFVLKGDEYKGREIPETQVLQGYGGQMIYLKRNDTYSTTDIINKAKGLDLVVNKH